VSLPVEGTVLVYLVNKSDRPDEEDAWFAARVRQDLDHLHVVVHLALLRYLSSDQLDGDLLNKIKACCHSRFQLAFTAGMPNIFYLNTVYPNFICQNCLYV
jgi:hypothetical protein